MADPADVARIRQFADDIPGGLQELVEQFIAHTAETVRELRAAVDAGDVPRVQMLAHRGAGTAGVCGAARLMELLREVESHAKANNPEPLHAAVAEVDAELAHVHAFLGRLLDEERSES
jgi:HPt (histidine-containing phosphotransfer) domain-containing protein